MHLHVRLFTDEAITVGAVGFGFGDGAFCLDGFDSCHLNLILLKCLLRLNESSLLATLLVPKFFGRSCVITRTCRCNIDQLLLSIPLYTIHYPGIQPARPAGAVHTMH